MKENNAKNLQLKALSMSVAFALSQREKEFSIGFQETYSTKDIEINGNRNGAVISSSLTALLIVVGSPYSYEIRLISDYKKLATFTTVQGSL